MFASIPALQRSSQTYLTEAMGRVSRSFALVVPWIEEPLQTYTATSYLICRTLDNIEDCGQPLAWQKVRFAEFGHLLGDPKLAPEMLSRWEAQPWPGLTSNEATLMTLVGGLPLWEIYAAFPDHIRSLMQRWILLMAQGMEEALDPAQSTLLVQHEGIRLLASVAAYNQYCYAVAGTVGGLGTELVIDHYGVSGAAAERLLAGSEACGRALQKTNIIKDFVEDLDRKVCYLPDEWLRVINHTPLALSGAPMQWSYTVLQDVLSELRMAADYVLAVPTQAKGYRIACLLCLLPAYQTLIKAAQRHSQLFTHDHQIKIARETMLRCVHEAISMATDDDAVLRRIQRLEQAVQQAFDRLPVYSINHSNSTASSTRLPSGIVA
jgi:farnesyl-diphosphate farnesyltransferase